MSDFGQTFARAFEAALAAGRAEAARAERATGDARVALASGRAAASRTLRTPPRPEAGSPIGRPIVPTPDGRAPVCGPARALAHGETDGRPDPVTLAEIAQGPDGTDPNEIPAREDASRVVDYYVRALAEGASPTEALARYRAMVDTTALAWAHGASRALARPMPWRVVAGIPTREEAPPVIAPPEQSRKRSRGRRKRSEAAMLRRR